jgi:hypothetical protein
VAFLQQPMAAVDRVPEDADAAPALTLRVHPNPFSSSTTITCALAGSDRSGLELGIFDASGRRVRTLKAGATATGITGVRWDGRDDAESPVAPGFYFCRTAGGGCAARTKILLVR